jgi:hypothetical protein
MDNFELNSQCSGSITKARPKLDQIWANVSKNECKLSVTYAYWPNFHKLIYVAFKLLNTLPMYNKKPTTTPFI